MKLVSILFILLAFNTAMAEPLDYFKPTYEECDKSFNDIFQTAKQKNPKAEIHQFLYPQGAIKSYFFPATQEQKNLLVLISGTHGIEAFAGSAVQRYLLDKGFDQKNMAVLMIHGFNLWGFKNYRRVNENNIDLNRNFILDRNHFKSDDSKYTIVDKFLNPEGSASSGFFSHTIFFIEAVYNIAVHGLETLRNAVLQGQYSYPNGIYFGGNEPQAQQLLIEQLIEKYFSPYKKVFLVDLHTGYGQRAKLHLLAGKSTDANSIALKTVFDEADIDFSDKDKFYTINGEMSEFFAEKIKEKTKAEAIGIVFEFGTMDSQKTLGSIESIRRVILENQNFHFPRQDQEGDNIKSLYREMFYPSDPAWRLSILQQTDEKMKKVYDYLNK